ncbi:sporulation protein YqfC [Candidatus Contubernalis alkaliaceticus]|uniref:sporulation protein YqfC n=1 Tax=Candidatus Contubernalis alkaliaceticus TaxID=338645 RepID=UPI001F4BE032|nr:sporulation protein YqfC [Candidatus Contubernalis alkalaceticus]UNC93131.1 sporulation protein YqfC [Candidatus Contubernalis alkalaceticus]
MNFKKSFRSSLAEAFELPKEILLDLPRVTLVGNVQIYVQNHRGVVEYSDKIIRVSVSGGELIIKGEGMTIKNIYSEEIFVEGIIYNLDYAV